MLRGYPGVAQVPDSMTTVSGTLEVGDDGQTLSGKYVFSVRLPDGMVVHVGQGTIEGTWINIFPMEELLPAATPAS